MRQIIIAFCLILTSATFAQQKWTLRECVEHAMKNNVQVRQKMIEASSAEIQLNTAKMSRLPDLNASLNQNFDFGRSTSSNGVIIDAKSASSTGFGLNTSVPVFTGFRITNEIESKKWNLKATLAELEKAKEDIALYVATAYLQVVYNRELYKVAVDQASLSKEQMQKAEILVGAGKLPQSELYETRATNARDESEVTRANTELKLSLVDLAQLLEIEKVADFDIDTSISDSLLVDGVVSLTDIDQTINNSLTTRPSMKSAEYRLEEGLKNLKVAKSGYYPTIDFGASYSNGYYYNFNQSTNTSLGVQLNDNARNAIGLSLNIPIFNRFATRNQVKLAKLDVESRKINLETARKTVLKDVQQAFYKAISSREKLNSAQKAMEASDLAFRFAKDKYEAGKSTSFEFNESNNRRLKSISDQVQAKYDFIFRCKILDFYNGKSIY